MAKDVFYVVTVDGRPADVAKGVGPFTFRGIVRASTMDRVWEAIVQKVEGYYEGGRWHILAFHVSDNELSECRMGWRPL